MSQRLSVSEVLVSQRFSASEVLCLRGIMSHRFSFSVFHSLKISEYQILRLSVLHILLSQNFLIEK